MFVHSIALAVVCLQAEKAELKLPRGAALTFAVCQISQDGKSVAVTTNGWMPREQIYTVMVPVTRRVKDKDGNIRDVVEMRAEQRTRVVKQIDQMRRVHPIEKCEFRDLNGVVPSAAEVAERLRKQSAVVLLRKGQKLDPFYRKVLKVSLLVAVLPEQRSVIPVPGRPPLALPDAVRPAKNPR